MLIYEIANLFTCLAEALVAFMLFDAFLEKRQNKRNRIYIIGILCLAVSINISNRIFHISYFNYIATISVTLLFSFMYRGKSGYRLFASVLSLAVSGLSEMSVLIVMMTVLNEQAAVIVANTAPRLIGIILSKTIMFLVTLYICVRKKKNYEHIDSRYWFLFTAVFVAMAINLYNFYAILAGGVDAGIRTLILISIISTSITMTIILFLYETNLKQNTHIFKQEAEQRNLNERIRHYRAMILSQAQLKGLRHDIKNHLISIRAKILHKEYNSCLEYVEELLNNAISTEKDEIDTGNTVLDAILNVKREEALSKNIRFIIRLQIPRDLPIRDDDISIIFGNALDNAIEACEEVKNEAYISIQMVYDNSSLVCRIENSCIGSLNNNITTKKDKQYHGIGKHNIEKALSNYDTVYNTTVKDNKYILSIIFMNIEY